MRNRVSFSYIDKYSNSYSTYSNTIFFAYGEKYTKIYKGGIKYTYVGGKNLTYIHHDLGTSYINVNDEKAVLYENEYDRYKYVIGEVDNNKKDISHKLYNNIQTEESIYTYINVPKNSYTYFPNVITGLTGKKYNIYKYAYAYSTNGMLAYDFTYDATDSSYGKHIANNDYDITYDIRGTYNFNNEPIRIQGIGFSVGSKDTAMYAGVEYDNILTIKVYGFNKENPSNPIHLKDENLYNSLNVEFPGTDEDAIKEITRTSESVTIKLTKENQHIGTILAKISLDWKNNKFTLYHQFTFAGIINEIDKINEFYYNVNGNTEYHTQLLEGDYITYTYVSTIPERANNTIKLELDTDPASYLNNFYDGTCEKTNNSSADYWYVVNTYVNQLNVDAAEMPVTITYNSSSELNDSTNIYRFVPSDIVFTYKYAEDDNEKLFNDDITEQIELYGKDKLVVNSNFKISYISKDNHYYEELIPTDNSNIINTYYTYYKKNDPNENNGEYTPTVSKLNYYNDLTNTNLSYSSYSFSYTIIEPGKYVFAYRSKNNDVTNNDALKILECYNNVIIESYEILTYEGASNQYLIDPSEYNNYVLTNTTSCTITYNDSNYNINIPDFNFVDWTYTHTYIDVKENSVRCNFGFVYDKNSMYDFNNNNIIEPEDLNFILNAMGGNWIDFPGYITINDETENKDEIEKNNTEVINIWKDILDLNKDNDIDISDVNGFINELLNGKRNLTPIIHSSDNGTDISMLKLSFDDSENIYKKLLISSHKIFIHKIRLNIGISIIYNNQDKLYDKTSFFVFNKMNDGDFIEIGATSQSSKNNKYFNLSDDIYNSIDLDNLSVNINIKISENDNFNSNVFNIDVNRYPDTEFFTDVTNNNNNDNGINLTYKFNKTNWENCTEKKSIIHKIKLNRIGDNKYSSDYWEAMGFKDAITNVKIIFERTKHNINEITLPDKIILFTNVSNNGDHSKSYKYKTSETEITNLQDIEKITIDKEPNNSNFDIEVIDNYNYNIKQGTTTLLTIKHIYDETDKKQYLEFTPLITSLEDANDITIKLIAKIIAKTDTVEKSFTVKLIELSMEMTVDKLHYIKDINDPNKILYEELLLSAQRAQDTEFETYQNTRKDNTWIKKFCNELVDESNLLEGYEFDNNCDNVIFKIISNGTSVDTNVPNGIKLSFIKNNIEYYKDERVLLPTSNTEDVYYILKNEYNVGEFKYSKKFKITMTESSIDNKANLFTNGKKEYINS